MAHEQGTEEQLKNRYQDQNLLYQICSCLRKMNTQTGEDTPKPDPVYCSSLKDNNLFVIQVKDLFH